MDELRITSEEGAHSADYSRGVYGARFEVFHNIEEAIVDIRMVSELHLDLIEVAKRVIQDGLLSLPLALTLLLSLLLLLLLAAHLLLWLLRRLRRLALCRTSRCIRREQTGLHLLRSSSLRWLNRPACKYIRGATGRSQRQVRLWLRSWARSCKLRIPQQSVGPVYCPRPNSYWLVEMYWRTLLSLMRRRLFEALSLLLAMSAILLFLDVYSMLLSFSFAFPFAISLAFCCTRRLACGLA